MVARFLKGQATRCLVSKVTPQRAFPEAAITPLGDVETVDTPQLAQLPLDPACEQLRGGSHQGARPYAMMLPEILYYPDQNQILTADRRILEQADQVPIRLHALDWRPFLGMAVRPLSGLCTTLRSFRDNYYHTLVDQLPLLYLLERWRETHAHEPTIKLLLAAPLTPAEDFFLARLLPPGVEVHPVQAGALYRMQRYLFVSFMSRRYSGYLPRDYVAWFRERAGVAKGGGRRRVFISRKHAVKGRHILNEDAVMAALAPLGFERISLERMPVAEQIACFADLECVVAAHGAGLANLLFASSASVVELFPQATVWPHFYLLSRAGNHRHHHICHQTARRDDDFSVNMPALRATVERVLSRRGET